MGHTISTTLMKTANNSTEMEKSSSLEMDKVTLPTNTPCFESLACRGGTIADQSLFIVLHHILGGGNVHTITDRVVKILDIF